MASWKGCKKLKLKKHRQTKKMKNETKKILHFGKLPNRANQPGNRDGVKDDQDGISNALQWQVRF